MMYRRYRAAREGVLGGPWMRYSREGEFAGPREAESGIRSRERRRCRRARRPVHARHGVAGHRARLSLVVPRAQLTGARGGPVGPRAAELECAAPARLSRNPRRRVHRGRPRRSRRRHLLGRRCRRAARTAALPARDHARRSYRASAGLPRPRAGVESRTSDRVSGSAAPSVRAMPVAGGPLRRPARVALVPRRRAWP